MEQLVEDENQDKKAFVLCVQYLISQHMKSKKPVKKDDLMKTVFKGRVVGKMYDKVMIEVEKTLKEVFGFSLSYINNNQKKFIIINDIEEINIPGINSSSSELSKYRFLLKPILGALVMLRSPISEAEMRNIMEKCSHEFNLDINVIMDVIKGDFVKDQYLQYKITDETTVARDPEKTSYWFSLGPRALKECNQLLLVERVSELYNVPAKSFKRAYAAANKKH